MEFLSIRLKNCCLTRKRFATQAPHNMTSAMAMSLQQASKRSMLNFDEVSLAASKAVIDLELKLKCMMIFGHVVVTSKFKHQVVQLRNNQGLSPAAAEPLQGSSR